MRKQQYGCHFRQAHVRHRLPKPRLAGSVRQFRFGTVQSRTGLLVRAVQATPAGLRSAGRGILKGTVKSVEGIYRDAKVELLEPLAGAEGSRVIVTLVRSAEPLDLGERGIGESQAADLRRRLAPFAEEVAPETEP